MPFCKFCGRKLEDGEVCSCAGAQEQKAQGVENTQEVYNQGSISSEEVNGQVNPKVSQFSDTYKDIKEKAIKFFSVKRNAAIALACVGVLILLIIICNLGGGYKKPIDNFVKVIENQETDIDKLVELVAPKFIEKHYSNIVDILGKSDEFEDFKDEASDSLEDTFDAMEDELGKKIKVSYKITDKDELSKRDIEDIEDAYKDLYDDDLEYYYDMLKDYDYDDMEDELDISSKDCEKIIDELRELIKEFKNPEISKGYEVTVEAKIEGDDDDIEEDIDLKLIKINGDWTIDYVSLLDEMGMSAGGLIGRYLY